MEGMEVNQIIEKQDEYIPIIEARLSAAQS